jgi:hypothetical protein
MNDTTLSQSRPLASSLPPSLLSLSLPPSFQEPLRRPHLLNRKQKASPHPTQNLLVLDLALPASRAERVSFWRF